MKKNEIIDYLKGKLVDDVDYYTESWFVDKAHSQLLSFSCMGGSKLLSCYMVDVVIGNEKRKR